MEWKIILAIVYALLSIQIFTILSVLIGLLYEPDNFKKPESFKTENHKFSKVIFEDTSQDLVMKKQDSRLSAKTLKEADGKIVEKDSSLTKT